MTTRLFNHSLIFRPGWAKSLTGLKAPFDERAGFSNVVGGPIMMDVIRLTQL